MLVGFGITSYKDYKEDGIWLNGNVLSYVGWSLGGAVIGALLGATIEEPILTGKATDIIRFIFGG